jgi:hypothetical protein
MASNIGRMAVRLKSTCRDPAVRPAVRLDAGGTFL